MTKTALRALTVLAALCAVVTLSASIASANPSDAPGAAPSTIGSQPAEPTGSDTGPGMMPPTSPDSCDTDTQHWDSASQQCVPGSGWEIGRGVYCPDGTIGHVTDTTGGNDCAERAVPAAPAEHTAQGVAPAPQAQQDRVIEHNQPVTSAVTPDAHSNVQTAVPAAASPDWRAISQQISAIVARVLAPLAH